MGDSDVCNTLLTKQPEGRKLQGPVGALADLGSAPGSVWEEQYMITMVQETWHSAETFGIGHTERDTKWGCRSQCYHAMGSSCHRQPWEPM